MDSGSGTTDIPFAPACRRYKHLLARLHLTAYRIGLPPVYVLLASDEASYISGARVAVTGGRPIL